MITIIFFAAIVTCSIIALSRTNRKLSIAQKEIKETRLSQKFLIEAVKELNSKSQSFEDYMDKDPIK